MSNRNATATWSGFSHQGQVGLLIALRKMKENGIDYASHFLEYEKTEDVAIYKIEENSDKKYISVHQVKAYYSDGSNLKAKYEKVLNDPFEGCGNDFLHTVQDITDWDTSTTTNSNSISRYEYEKDVFFCDITHVEVLIKKELEFFLGNDQGRINSALHRLISSLDLKIRQEHTKKHKPLFDIKFSFTELEEVVSNTEDFVLNQIYTCRKNFYDEFIYRIKTKNYDQARIDKITSLIIDPIYGLPDDDFLIFLMRLNLDVRPEKINYSTYHFNPTGFNSVFFKSLLEIILETPTIEEGVVKYKKNGIAEKFVITTITALQEDAETIVENIFKNCVTQNILWDNHALINGSIEGNFVSLNPNIMNIPKEQDEKDKFMSFSSSNRLIKVEEAKIILDNE